MTAPPELCPPHMPVEVFKDYLESNPAVVGMQDAETFDREAAYLRWLEASRTFEMLGEAGSTPGLASKRLTAWLWSIGYDFPLGELWSEHFTRLCGLFGVPAVFVELGYADDWTLATTTWQPPSPALAAAVLRHCMEHGVHDDASLVAEMERIGPQGMCDCLTCCMRQHMNVTGATTVRLRFGAAGEWHIETGV